MITICKYTLNHDKVSIHCVLLTPQWKLSLKSPSMQAGESWSFKFSIARLDKRNRKFSPISIITKAKNDHVFVCPRTGFVHQELRDFVKLTLTRVLSDWVWLESSHSMKNVTQVEPPFFSTWLESSHQKPWLESRYHWRRLLLIWFRNIVIFLIQLLFHINFCYGHSFFHWIIRFRCEQKWYRIQSKSKKFLISGRIGLRNLDPAHHCCTPEMSGLSYFAIQIQAWFVKTQSKSNHSPKNFSDVKSKSKLSPEILKNATFQNKNVAFLFH